MTVIGTLKNIPVIPQIDPQIESANSVANELMFNVLPIIDYIAYKDLD